MILSFFNVYYIVQIILARLKAKNPDSPGKIIK
jgi:hypothetical protein